MAIIPLAWGKKLQYENIFSFYVIKLIFFILTLTLSASCRQKKTETIPGASSKEITIERKFVKIQPLNERYYELYLRSGNDSIEVFVTLMPLSQTEINSLKKEGNNIILTYQEYYNPVKKQIAKIVKSMTPQYEFQGK